MPDNWVALRGQTTYQDGKVTLVPNLPAAADDTTSSPSTPFAEARSNISFDSGTIKFEAILADTSSRAQLALNSGKDPELYVGLNVGNSAYGVAVFRNGKWDQGRTAGFGNKADVNRWIPIEVRVIGSEIELFVDDVRVTSFSETFPRSQLGVLLSGNGPTAIRNVIVESRRPIVFVVMQFTEEYNVLFAEVIKPTCEKFGYRVIRGDDSSYTGQIIEDITRAIRECAIVLADITPDNPNVFYEVGFSHALGKPTILLSDRKRAKLPFDVSGFRTLFYDNSIGGKSAVESALTEHLKAIAI